MEGIFDNTEEFSFVQVWLEKRNEINCGSPWKTFSNILFVSKFIYYALNSYNLEMHYFHFTGLIIVLSSVSINCKDVQNDFMKSIRRYADAVAENDPDIIEQVSSKTWVLLNKKSICKEKI